MEWSNRELQERLRQYYSQQLSRYESLMTQVQRMRGTPEDSDEAVVSVKSILQDISNCENENTSLRRAWRSVGTDASPELKETVRRVSVLLEQLIESVSLTEREVLGEQDGLRPEIRAEATRRKIAAAYKSG